MSLLSVKNLHVTFDTESGPVEAVRGVSFDLNRERLGIVGESGLGQDHDRPCGAAADPPAGPDRGGCHEFRRPGPDRGIRGARCAICAATASPW